MNRIRPLVALAVAGALLLSACGSDDGASGSTDTTVVQTLTVGSGNFSESQVLAEIYAQALEKQGVRVQRQLNIGNREVYYKAISEGQVDLLPEYTNSLLSYVLRQKDPAAVPTATNVAEQVEALQTALPDSLTVGNASAAEDKDVIVCTKAAADAHSLTNLSDLAKVSADITLGAPPEFEGRSPFGVAGFKEIYGASDFKKFVPLPIGEVSAALKTGSIDCGNLFSTDVDITANGFVALDDDKHVVANEAVLPLLTFKAATPHVLEVVNAISATLTTDILKQLVVQVVTDKKAPDVVASEYIAGLTPSSS